MSNRGARPRSANRLSVRKRRSRTLLAVPVLLRHLEIDDITLGKSKEAGQAGSVREGGRVGRRPTSFGPYKTAIKLSQKVVMIIHQFYFLKLSSGRLTGPVREARPTDEGGVFFQGQSSGLPGHGAKRADVFTMYVVSGSSSRGRRSRPDACRRYIWVCCKSAFGGSCESDW